MIITFIGHSSMNINNVLSNKIKNAIQLNLYKYSPVTFYCGGYGDFDLHCASLCRSLKNDFPACSIVFVTPYITPSQQRKLKYLIEEHFYDSTIYPPIENTPPRFAITKRNEWMIAKSDLVIAYVAHNYGGAHKSLEYARKKNKFVINLAES